jgi:hypothetical protein
MTPPELPDDPRDWPDDPFAVLGVRRGAEEAEIKRTYTRLIRRFKPEHFPEQFRRVRDAYEACLAQSQWHAPAEPEPAPEPVLPGPWLTEADDADRLWEQFAEGREAEAYTGFVGLASARPDRADVPLRLYWMLALSPDLDPTRRRHDWLGAALRAARLTGPAVELYRRELEAGPKGALSGPYRQLLSSPAEIGTVLAVARMRVAAAGRCRFWKALHRDLSVLRGRVPAGDEAGLLGWLVAVLDWCEWERPDPLHTACRDELSTLRHLGLSHAGWFDRVDELRKLAPAWREGERFGLPYPVLDLIRVGWANGGWLPPADVAAAAAAVRPAAVRTVQRLQRLSVFMPSWVGLLAYLCDWLGGFKEQQAGPEYPPELVRGVYRARLGWWPDQTYGPDLIEFLAAQALDPSELVAALEVAPDRWLREHARRLRGDLALRAVALLLRSM